MADKGTEKKKVWTVRASQEIASFKKELEASKDLLAEKELKISSQECELKDLREELEKKKEELFYVKKRKGEPRELGGRDERVREHNNA